ncbi:hypothetical protein IMZ48_32615 [Candidatus Bathyarchaeota archaeon]|nr:hypothetical protein [Candidatus Bathyarchaeota archaeon]
MATDPSEGRRAAIAPDEPSSRAAKMDVVRMVDFAPGVRSVTGIIKIDGDW